MKKILLTGEDGFLGRNIKKLLKNKKYQLIKKPQKKKYTMDLRYPEKVKKFLYLKKPDVIINAAVRADFKKKYSEEMMNINYKSVKEMVNYCRKKEKKLIQISGTIVHPKSKKYNIKTKEKPKNFYGRTKLKADKYIIKNKINYAIVRFGGIFGENGPRHLFINRILNSKKNIKYEGDYNFKRNYIHVYDAAKNIIKLIGIDKKGTFYCGGETNTFAQMLKVIQKKKNINIDMNFIKREDIDEIVINNKFFKFRKFEKCL